MNGVYIKAWSDWLEFVRMFNRYKHLTFNDFKNVFNGTDNDIIYTVYFKTLQIGVSPMFDTIGSLSSKDKTYYVSCHIIIRNSNNDILDHMNYMDLRELVSELQHKIKSIA